jgi:hypothetical protein
MTLVLPLRADVPGKDDAMFVYTPKSGSRVFSLNEAAACNFVRVLKYANNSYQVVGGVQLEFVTARPGQYWRYEARQGAELLVSSYGGLAWDDKGVINIIVPKRAAKVSIQTMAVIRAKYTPTPQPSLEENMLNALSAAIAGWETIPHNNMCSVDWGLPQFSLGEFKGVDEEIVGPISCRKVGEKYLYSIGKNISWTAPWAAINVPIEPEEEVPTSCEEPCVGVHAPAMAD